MVRQKGPHALTLVIESYGLRCLRTPQRLFYAGRNFWELVSPIAESLSPTLVCAVWTMFGTFRYNNSLKEAEYVELSRESGVDARGYTLLVSLHHPHHAWPALLTAITGMRTLSCPQGKPRRPR